MEDGVLKEGFLVKRGHIVPNWKARWFVLRQNTLLYYKLEGGRRVTPPKGRILLDGCTITCPCLEYENRPLLIKLKTRNSTEYFLEACSREERDAWAFEITGAIHAGQPGKVQQLHILKNSFKLPPHISLHRIVDKMHDSSSGIRPCPNMEQGSTYKKTFLGSSLVDWLISSSFAASRLEAVTLASVLMEENYLRPVGARSMGAVRSGDLAEQFLDDSTALYTFAESYKKKISSREEISLSTMELSGTVVKQGYLSKQGHKRKNWKVRRFVLRKDPAFLHYYDPSKLELFCALDESRVSACHRLRHFAVICSWARLCLHTARCLADCPPRSQGLLLLGCLPCSQGLLPKATSASSLRKRTDQWEGFLFVGHSCRLWRTMVSPLGLKGMSKEISSK
uniref:pleckstrin-2 isoform X1 n=1 Tax=Jaculus jaculus TaxID=51337 RepID=UPI001E1B1E74|nr:pleckstrin-2 isoform X1 [Jaculus jaculus]